VEAGGDEELTAEGAHLGAGGDAGVKPDKGEDLRVLHDGVGELAGPLAVCALATGPFPRRQTFSWVQAAPEPMQ